MKKKHYKKVVKKRKHKKLEDKNILKFLEKLCERND